MATQHMGKSQVGGSIIGMFLDLTREAFQSNWATMEEVMSGEQVRIGSECCDMNLLKETMGKIGVLDTHGKVSYPIDVSYDMGWQKSAKTYGSLSGHRLMVGSCTKNVVAYQNFSKTCDICCCHTRKMIAAKTPDIEVSKH